MHKSPHHIDKDHILLEQGQSIVLMYLDLVEAALGYRKEIEEPYPTLKSSIHDVL